MNTATFSPFTIQPIHQVLTQLHTAESGISDKEAGIRKTQYGENVLSSRKVTALDILIRQVLSPFIYLLIGAALISFLLHEMLDGWMILLFVVINTLLGFIQEYRSEKTVELLRHLIVNKCTVLRDGHEQLVQTSHLVPGDVVLLRPGDVLPADIRFLTTENLTIDESILTGESATVSKTHEAMQKQTKEIYEAKNIGFSGTHVVTGEGKAVIIATGKNTTIGSIAALTTQTHHESSFEKGISKLSSFILKLVVVTLVIVVLMNLFIKGVSDVPIIIVFAIALAVSVIPEALPVVTTFSFSRGALHLAKHKVVVKRLASIEDLGSIEVLCTDKTGTITENKLQVTSVFPKRDDIVFSAALAADGTTKQGVDPFDIALLNRLSDDQRTQRATYTKIDEVPFDPTRKRNVVVMQSKKEQLLLVRGAAETILSLCSNIENHKEITAWIKTQGEQGKRVLAVAQKKLSKKPDNPQKEEHDLTLVGLVAFEDPLKPTTTKAIAQAEKVGLTIKIITGDSREVAGFVGRQIGLIQDQSHVLTGDELEKLPVDKQQAAVDQYHIFARVSPQQKHMIIQLLQKKYEVGFLGEGINDAPALKAANVAIVVESASDIARDTADIVLLSKSLHVVVEGITEGRAIFANTAKYIKATLASNFGNFYTVAISSLFIPFLPLLPLQILLINLLTDFPMIAVATDNVDSIDLQRPRSYDVRSIVLFATAMGIVSSLFDFLFFALFVQISPSVLQTNWFIGSVLTELVLLFAIRTRLPLLKATRPSLPLVCLSVAAFLTAIVLPFTFLGQDVFSFTPPTITYMLMIFGLTVAYFVTTEIVKNMYYKRFTS